MGREADAQLYVFPLPISLMILYGSQPVFKILASSSSTFPFTFNSLDVPNGDGVANVSVPVAASQD